MQLTALKRLIAGQRPGWSLARPFYVSNEIYEWERRGWLAEQWYVIGHCSEVSVPGAFIVRELLGESIIVVRQTPDTIGGFYNVCRHRGSRICDRDGRASALVCPYHGWSFRLDGSVRSIPARTSGLDIEQLRLQSVSICEIGGILLASLTGTREQLSSIRETAAELLAYHGIPRARVAAQRSYPTLANWKLVMENFLECYHCYPAHPEYCSIMKHVELLGRNSTAEWKKEWAEEIERWFREEADSASPAASCRTDYSRARPTQGVMRSPIGGGRKTQTQDGEPVSRLMGLQSKFDGGINSFYVFPFSFVLLLNDHAVMFHFLPKGAEETDVRITWLVDGNARDLDLDVERLTWMWDVTTRQDKELVERNAKGVRSDAYKPGPYAVELEAGPDSFVQRYLLDFAATCDRVGNSADVSE